jgi:hypothetical protein
MTKTQTNPRTAAKGDIVTFTPTGRKNQVTVKIVGTFDGCGVYGYRAKVDTDGTVSTSGNPHAYFC